MITPSLLGTRQMNTNRLSFVATFMRSCTVLEAQSRAPFTRHIPGYYCKDWV